MDVAINYQLTNCQFSSLFTDTLEERTLEDLTQSASNGNLKSIDLLLNLALRQDPIGAQAEGILFDLFAGKRASYLGGDSDIQKASLVLYNLACADKASNNVDMHKLHSRSKLLYLAGSAMSDVTKKRELTQVLLGENIAQSQNEQIAEHDLWGSNRMLTTDDINAAMKNIAQRGDHLSLNYPIGLTCAQTSENLLSTQIADKITNMDFLEKPEYFPLNTGGHWILFGLHKDESSGSIKTVVFNSSGELDSTTKAKLIDAAKMAGVTDEIDFTFIEKNIQDLVPNGCGLFVTKALDLIADAQGIDPVLILERFAEKFVNRPAEEQSIFNIEYRRQLFEHHLAQSIIA
ncbi:ElaD/SseL family deubiquitinase [Biostraticola tofi]|uniref:Deubiquitinase SseL n=1 Tax=Biostraticola tofi TaxID=466109 RepID=A0A4R3Z3R5_9GAMM|nr:ElaD/SseL family deubiquitinase [Biostraticola tofi]TCV99792.1 deubiquitinase [Biostraticola tofi]